MALQHNENKSPHQTKKKGGKITKESSSEPDALAEGAAGGTGAFPDEKLVLVDEELFFLSELGVDRESDRGVERGVPLCYFRGSL